MRSLARIFALIAAILCTGADPSLAQARVGTEAGKIVVGTMRVPPFVLRGDDGQWHGLSIELGQQIAAELKAPIELREFDYDPAGLLEALERGEIDAALAAIPITHDAETHFDFTHPYFSAGLGILVRTEPDGGLLATIGNLMTLRTAAIVGGLVALLVAVGASIWLLERRQGAHFDQRFLPGVGDGIWWAAVTMTTTGYGDKVPIGWGGRTLALLWMFSSIFLVSVFSATLASSFVVGQLKTGVTGPNDLPRARVAVVAGTTGEEWSSLQGLTVRNYPFVIQASKALQRGDVQALVHERAILGHMIKTYGWRELQILPHTLAVRDYAIALPQGSPLTEPINRALLKIVHGPAWKDVVQKYVGTANEP
ncbi:transporter substrate-binding domain-containing protein [Bradyrhizobium sp. LHD-71]|uniref:transporter substrate-binding domain-containing protein n=1 Tax=Bradyrhizobium sp. LHD-71 TaxID=3072141 RepID=UPI00280DFBF0|nr:transporter substrate-binding domain-containing protein [Bradyrhizobium sp. LHD-71]MDQ8726620.1 transporter substrate-binding domain-containing protein [Bradyrhizobium sp. LHD-71]